MVLRTVLLLLVATAPSQRYDHPKLEATRQTLSTFLNADSGELVIHGHLHAYHDCWKVVCEHIELGDGSTDEMRDFACTPDIWSKRLCRVREDSRWCVQSPKDLQGFVAIADATEALQYLRCFSNLFARRLFSEHHYVEVLDRQSWTPGFPCADYEVLHAHTGVRKTGIVAEGDGAFVAIRYLLEYEQVLRPSCLHVAVERLSRVGEYEITLIKTYPYKEVRGMIRMPLFGNPR